MNIPTRPTPHALYEPEPHIEKLRGWPMVGVWLGAIAFSLAAWAGIIAALFSLTRGQ